MIARNWPMITPRLRRDSSRPHRGGAVRSTPKNLFTAFDLVFFDDHLVVLYR